MSVMAAADHVFGDRGLTHLDPKFQQFAVNARRTPTRICVRHVANQRPDLTGDDGPAEAAPAPPGPARAEAATVPRNDRLRLDDHQVRAPLVPDLR